MSSIRQNKIEGVIQEELSMFFQRNAREICLGAMVSVTIVRVTSDLSLARCYLSVFTGPDKKEVLESHDKAEHTAWWSLLGNFLMAIVKATVGFFGNSYALIADAIESIGDVFSSMLVIIGIRYAKRPPDENHPG